MPASAPAHPVQDLTFEQWSPSSGHLTGSFLCAQAFIPQDEEPEPQGVRCITRLVSAQCTSDVLPTRLLLRPARTDRMPVHCPPWPRIQHRLRPDRHRQLRRRPATRDTARGRLQATAGSLRAAHGFRARGPGPRLHGHPAARSKRPFMTVMATKFPTSVPAETGASGATLPSPAASRQDRRYLDSVRHLSPFATCFRTSVASRDGLRSSEFLDQRSP